MSHFSAYLKDVYFYHQFIANALLEICRLFFTILKLNLSLRNSSRAYVTRALQNQIFAFNIPVVFVVCISSNLDKILVYLTTKRYDSSRSKLVDYGKFT